ncbi:4Fe-4S binding protein [Fundidesulfovibrio butyratiphilus]
MPGNDIGRNAMKILRKIVEIDEELCNGCGQCLPNCAEGAIVLVDGKARLKAEQFCDGLGACLGHCPMDAIRIVEREAEDFDEEAVHAELAAAHDETPAPLACGCAGSHAQVLQAPRDMIAARACPGATGATLPGAGRLASPGPAATPNAALSGLGHWPVKLRLAPPDAPFLKGADILIMADCAAVAIPDLHERIAGKVVLTACPKFDDPKPYIEKLIQILRSAAPTGVSVLRMEVPCCSGLSALVHQAARLAETDTPVRDLVVARTGEVVPERRAEPSLASHPLTAPTVPVAR